LLYWRLAHHAPFETYASSGPNVTAAEAAVVGDAAEPVDGGEYFAERAA
jgi:hypothetical protein